MMMNVTGETASGVQRFMRIPAALAQIECMYECRCACSVPPQALLAVEIEGVLCTAGMKAGWRSNRSLFRLGTLGSKKVGG